MNEKCWLLIPDLEVIQHMIILYACKEIRTHEENGGQELDQKRAAQRREVLQEFMGCKNVEEGNGIHND